jgi:hypothetical protein
MPEPSLKERVEFLEQKVEELQALPTRMEAVELQIQQLRDEMREGFSANDRRFTELERQIGEGDQETRRYMRVLHEEVLARISLIQEKGRRRR